MRSSPRPGPPREGEALQHHYRLSLDGGRTWGRERTTDYLIDLRFGKFDPLVDAEPAVPADLRAPADNRLWIVQYVTKGVEPWREEIRALGGRDHRFLANHANIWEMDAAVAEEVAQLEYVRWVGVFQPVYKLEDELVAQHAAGELKHARYNVVAAVWGPEQKGPLAQRMSELGGIVEEAHDEGWRMSATLSPAALVELAKDPRVLGIDRWSEPEEDMDNARALFGGNHIETQLGLTGHGVRAEVMDGGLDTNHVDWNNSPLLSTTNSGSNSHGTCTFGINFANGNSTAGGQSRGMLPDAQGVFADYSNYGNRYTHTAKIVDPNQSYRVVFQSNSWGGSRTTSYNSTSQEMDDIIFINDVSILQSQSNAGDQMSRPQAWAKNIISVGGIKHQNNQNYADDHWTFGASIGPAADGRIKPDIACWYENVWTSDAEPGGYVSGDDYTNMGGTSAATPMVAGHLGLIYEMWANGVFGNPVNGTGDAFDNKPHNTLAKALLLNSTRQWDFVGTGHDLTRVHQGWGAPNLTNLYDDRNLTLYVDESTVLPDQGAASWAVDVPAGQPEFRATLVYLDLAGTTSSGQHRINDLSLRVTDPSGTIYWGNNGLLAGMESTSGGSSNTKDTVEQVILENPAAGTWTVDVFADEVNQDSHVETAAVDADFALVVTPVSSWVGAEPTDTISLSGPTNPFPGVPFAYTFTGAPPNRNVYMGRSFNLNGMTFQGHEFDIGAPFVQVAITSSNLNGDGAFLLSLPPAASGRTMHLELASSFGGQWYDSNPHTMTVQ